MAKRSLLSERPSYRRFKVPIASRPTTHPTINHVQEYLHVISGYNTYFILTSPYI